MAFKKIKAHTQGKDTEVNGEGNEKDDNSSTTKAELATLSTQDLNAKVAGLAKGGQSS